MRETERVTAAPKERANCPSCGAIVIAKCGRIKIWHWSHQSRQDCDPWWEPESAWHLQWKQLVQPEYCEVVRTPHRADIVGRNGMVIELQYSAISPEEIEVREAFYGRMIWLIDARDFRKHLDFRESPKGYHTFRWKHPRKSLWHCRAPIFLDFGREISQTGEDFDEDGNFYYRTIWYPRIFQVRKIYRETPCGGWGHFFTPERFKLKYLWGMLKPEGKAP